MREGVVGIDKVCGRGEDVDSAHSDDHHHRPGGGRGGVGWVTRVRVTRVRVRVRVRVSLVALY